MQVRATARRPGDRQFPELTPILDTVLDAVVIIELNGRVVGWNGVAEETFGWSAHAAVGQPLADLIVPPQHREAHNAGLARLLAGEQPRVLNRRIELTALTAAGTEIPIELSITTTRTADGPLFIGFLRDISNKRAAEQALRRQASEAQLMFDIARMAAEADSFEGALEEVLAAICRLSGWSVGHAFVVPDGDPPRLVSTSIWYEDEPGAAEPMRAATQAIEFAPGVGLPGTILVRGEPLWIADADRHANFPRASSGFRGAFGFPLKAGARIIAILEFFARTPTPPDAERLLTVRTLGEQVGRVFERRRREDRERLLLHELNHRVKNLLMVIQAIASQTFRSAASQEEGLSAFSGRLQALAKAQDLMLAANWTEVSLRDLLETALGGSGHALDRFKIEGPELKVLPSRSVPIALAAHELCTNSVKYGALSLPDGLVEITWSVDEGRHNVTLEWREVGGPPVSAPTRQGFGSKLLVTNLARELGGEVSADYRPEGLVFRVHAPLSDVNRTS
jgi:PAS domain S-box-containing protein